MIKPVHRPQQTPGTTSTKETSRAGKKSGMLATAEGIKKLAQRLPFGAGRHTFSEKPNNPSIAKKAAKVVKERI